LYTISDAVLLYMNCEQAIMLMVLGYAGTNGTVGYRLAKYGLVALGDPVNVLTIYYPDELKDMDVRVLLMKVCE